MAMRGAGVALLVACSSAPPHPAPVAATPADASVVAVAPPDAAVPDAEPAELCKSALAELAHGAAITQVSPDAQDFVITAAEQKAIGRAAKASEIRNYEGREQKAIARAYDRWIAAGAALEVKQAIAQPRAVVITFPFDSGIPHADSGPRLMVVADGPHGWRAFGPFSFDPDARFYGTVDHDGDGEPELIFDVLVDAATEDLWRIDLAPHGDDPGAALAAARCD